MGTYEVETSVTLSYREQSWGLERIILDAVQNHLPADSGGKRAEVQALVSGAWVPLLDFPGRNVDEFRVADDGPGYDAQLLSLLYSTKRDAKSAGQFGEGLKMLAAACLRNGIEVRLRSRDWEAVPYAQHMSVDGEKVERLCFRVSDGLPRISGSRTLFPHPDRKLLEEALALPEKVLYFASPEVLYSSTGYWSELPSRILAAEKPRLFVKGIAVQKIDALFSYDLSIDDITPDRRFANHGTVLYRLGSLLTDCTSREVISGVITAARERPHASLLEFDSLKDTKGSRGGRAWKEAFFALFGDNAVLASRRDSNINADAEAMSMRPVGLNLHVADYLSSVGVPGAESVLQRKEYRWTPLDELTAAEHELLSLGKRIARKSLLTTSFELRVYEGLYLPSGREVESSMGVHLVERRMLRDVHILGVKRALLGDRREFARTVTHEAGHAASGAGDHEREFAQYFVERLTDYILDELRAEEVPDEETGDDDAGEHRAQ